MIYSINPLVIQYEKKSFEFWIIQHFLIMLFKTQMICIYTNLSSVVESCSLIARIMISCTYSRWLIALGLVSWLGWMVMMLTSRSVTQEVRYKCLHIFFTVSGLFEKNQSMQSGCLLMRNVTTLFTYPPSVTFRGPLVSKKVKSLFRGVMELLISSVRMSSFVSY